MPRRGRIVLANRPHHVVQRGHNRQVVFGGDDDYRYYLATMREWKETLGCKVYAYCLMSNHVHLVVDPGEAPRHLGLFMKRVAARQTRLVNRLLRRSGTLWGSRFHSSPIETDAYLLACCRYLEMNPVRAGMVAVPEVYPWSSCRSRVGIERTEWLDDDPCYSALGANPSWRARRYREWLQAAAPQGEWDLIRMAVQRNQLTGGNRFTEEVEEKIGVRIEMRGQGRPKREGNQGKGDRSIFRGGK